MSLTPKQQRFVDARVGGLDASAAYRLAYDTANMKSATINRKAHELTQHGKITARLAELRSAAAEHAQITADSVVEGLRSIAEDQEAHAGARVSAYTVLAKHLGVIADGSTLNVGGDHREIHVHLDGGPRDEKGSTA